jgi:hypothetical protein
MPAVYMHAANIYDRMVQESQMVEIEGQSVNIWEGFTTALFEEAGLAVPYYTSVLQLLKSMGCIQQYRRGGGTSASQWLLLRAPDQATYERHRGQTGRRQTKPRPEEQRWRDLTKRLERCERALGIPPS